ncbi:MAG: reverse transcriptase, partial [Nitrospiria bacterium]
LFYARFVDDWVVIAPTYWRLRSVIRMVNETLRELRLGKHPDKTFIEKVERGFDFLGYFLTPTRMIPSLESLRRFAKRIARLYEQGADSVRIGQYVSRWNL